MIDVTVVDYDTPTLARQCVASLDSPLFASIELVDAKRHGWGYGKAANWSAAHGDAPIVLILNADTQMLREPRAVLDIFDSDPAIAVVGPRQVDSQLRVTHAGIIGDNHLRAHRFWMHPLPMVDGQCSERTRDVPTVAGSVYFCRRQVWEELGGFLETRHFYEETFLDFKARKAGYRVVYTGATTWLHEFNQSPVDEPWRVKMAVEARGVFAHACNEAGIDATP